MWPFSNQQTVAIQGQEVHVNQKRGRKFNMRHVQRIIRCKMAMAKTTDRRLYDDLANEIFKRTKLLEFEGFTVPDDIPGLQKLYELTRIN